MKKSRIIILLFIAGILGASAASHGVIFYDSDQAMTTEPIDPEDIAVEEDTVYVWQSDSTREYLPGEVRDTAQFNKINTISFYAFLPNYLYLIFLHYDLDERLIVLIFFYL